MFATITIEENGKLINLSEVEANTIAYNIPPVELELSSEYAIQKLTELLSNGERTAHDWDSLVDDISLVAKHHPTLYIELVVVGCENPSKYCMKESKFLVLPAKITFDPMTLGQMEEFGLVK